MPRQNSINTPTTFTVPDGGTGLSTVTPDGLLVGNGTGNLSIITGTGSEIVQSNGTSPIFVPYMQGELRVDLMGIFQEQQASAVNAGTFTSGAWRTRNINTSVLNNIPSASLSSNQVTLPIGSYFIRAWATAGRTLLNSASISRHQTRLQNITASTTLFVGTSEFIYHGGTTDTEGQTHSFIHGFFSLGSSSAIELQHRAQVTSGSGSSNVGFGRGRNFGYDPQVGIFSSMFIWRVG